MKYHRLKTRDEFRAIIKNGHRLHGRFLTIYCVVDSSENCVNKAGFIITKAVGVAVKRNLFKRRLAGISREIDHENSGCLWLVMRAKPAIANASYADLRTEVSELLKKIAHV